MSEIRQEYVPDPTTDLVPVCPNCHAVIHWGVAEARTIDEVKQMLQRNAGKGGSVQGAAKGIKVSPDRKA